MIASLTSTIGSTVGYGTATLVVSPSPEGVAAITDFILSSEESTEPDEPSTLIPSMEESTGIVLFEKTTGRASLIVALLSCAEIDRSNPEAARSSEKRARVVVFIFKSDRETL